MRTLALVSAVWETGRLDTLGLPQWLEERGHEVTVVSANDLRCGDDPTAGQSFDVLLCRFANQPVAIEASARVAAAGVPVVAGGLGVAVARDHGLTLDALTGRALPTPDYAMLTAETDAVEEVGEQLGWPLVIKDVHSVGGAGVSLADDIEVARQRLEVASQAGARLVAQRYHPEAAGQDIRLLVVGEDVVGAIRRVARPGDFRANLYLGGRWHDHATTTSERHLAVAAADAVDLDIAGVDIMQTVRGPVVLEVNPKPGITGMNRAVPAMGELVEAVARGSAPARTRWR